MPTLLHLDSSPVKAKSRSRKLTQEFTTAWSKKSDQHKTVYRDLLAEPVPFVDELWVEAAYKDPGTLTADEKAHLAFSDRIIDEFLAADVVLFGVPMHNLGLPAPLKAYLDQLIRNGRTLGEHGKSLVPEKKLILITSRGGYCRPGTPTAHYDLQAPYLSAIFGMLGQKDIEFIHVEGQRPTSPIDDSTLAEARENIVRIAASL